MHTKKGFYTELAYILGIVVLALGTAMMERANMGMSMVVAPAYLLHLKISQFFPAFTFGTAEYVFQAVLLVVLSIVMGRAKKGYLFSFVTAVLYGLVLDLAMTLIGMVPGSGPVFRLFFYLAGMVVCSAGVALLFHTYIAPEAYELFVKEIAGKYGFRIDRVKTVYDCCSCAVGIALSFAFFGWGHFEGVKMGTIFCALINGWMIGRISSWLESVFIFRDGLPFRPIFEE
jgi:uncharacterized membrane protein YczE